MTKDFSNFKIEDGTFKSSAKEKNHIYYLHYLPEKKLKKKIIHIIFQHGIIEYHKRHEPLFLSLLEHFGEDLVVSAMDLVGHGRSGGNRGYVDNFDNYTDDWLQFLAKCQERFYNEHDVTTFVIAHSLGGLIMINTLGNEQLELPINIKALILTNPCISPYFKVSKMMSKFLAYVNDKFGKIRIPVNYSPYDLTHDVDRANDFARDQLISSTITIKLASEILRVTKNISRHSYFFKYPTFFILSGQDKAVDNKKTRLFIAGMDKTQIKCSEYPDMYHDILNETCRNEVFLEIIKYIKSNIEAT